MRREVVLTADKVRRRKRIKRIIKLALLILLLLLSITYVLLRIIYSDSKFVITLNSISDGDLAIYESMGNNKPQTRLEADVLEFMDNITWKWLPNDLGTRAEGSHNGENFIAYTFFAENTGEDVLNYWYEVNVDLVTRRVDEAIRIMIIVNDESVVYAKINENGQPEQDPKDTVPFVEDKKDTVVLAQRTGLDPGGIDRVTIVIWIEGEDPDCVNYLIGGVMKMHMKITEERTR